MTELSNDSHLSQLLTLNSTISTHMHCYISRSGSFTAQGITNIILLLPLCIFILCHGLREWQQKHSTPSFTLSHSDSITYHMVIMELIGVIGSMLLCCGIYKVDFNILQMSVFHFSFTWFGQTFFHMLTCVEHYVAVVHPITYLSLRNEKGIRIRNITVGCVWLLCFVGLGLVTIKYYFIIGDFLLLILALTVVSFCSFSVLCVLIRSGPGKQGERKEKVDQSKQRAFYTIVTILGVLVLRFSCGLSRAVMFVSLGYEHCGLTISEFWLTASSSLVLPFLFLQRARKRVCFERTQSPN